MRLSKSVRIRTKFTLPLTPGRGLTRIGRRRGAPGGNARANTFRRTNSIAPLIWPSSGSSNTGSTQTSSLQIPAKLSLPDKKFSRAN
jgi:hypothetical protein